MTDPQEKPTDKLERMLRHWGAEEAEQSAHAPPAPNLAEALRPPGRAWPALLRWSPLAAAAVLLAGAFGFYLAARRTPLEQGMRGGRIEDVIPRLAAPPPGANDLHKLQEEVAELRQLREDNEKRLQEFSALPQKVAAVGEELDRERRQHAADVAEFLAARRAHEKEKAELTDANRVLTAKVAALQGQAAGLAELAKKVAELEPLAAEAAKLRAANQGLTQRLAAAVNEINELRRQREDADAIAADARKTVQALEARHTEVVAAFQRTYLASLAPNERGLAARKTAVRVRRMVERCAALSTEVRHESTKKLLGRLEAVLTRLDLLNPARIGSQESFGKLLDEADLTRQIDEIISAGTESEGIRTWLFEAKLILLGAGHAG